MNFTRSLLATMLIALFGAIVAGTLSIAAGAPAGLRGLLPQDAALAAEAFRRVFFAVAIVQTVALVALVLLEEKPLRTGVSA